MGRHVYRYYLLVVALAVLRAHSREIESSRSEVTGAGEEGTIHQDTLSEALRKVCSNAETAFNDDAYPLSNDGELVERYSEFLKKLNGPLLMDKPATTPGNSVCIGLNLTCCTSNAEKALPVVVSKEYREVYHTVLQDEYFLTCPNTGRESYHSMRRALIEAKRLLSIDVKEVLNGTLHKGAFDKLFDYLTQFSITPYLCPLQRVIRQEVEDLLITIFMNMNSINDDSEYSVDNIDDDYLSCLTNISRPYLSNLTDEITSTLQSFLWDYRVYVKSVFLARKVINTVKNHQYSPACVSALARIKHCSYCGGYRRFHPCLNFCLNTVRGCFADVAELSDDFESFVTELKTLSKSIDSELKPEAIVANQLKRFVTMVGEVRTQSSLQSITARDCAPAQTGVEDSTSDYSTHRRSRRSRFTQPINRDSKDRSGTSFNPNRDLSDDTVAIAFVYEMDCLGAFQQLLTTIPQEMCYLGKTNPITQGLNTQCWTGTTLGEYDEPLVGLSKAEQANNPAFVFQSMDQDIIYTPLIQEIQTMTSEIKNLVTFRDNCAEGDDEDCARVIMYECETVYSGSGSSSGSGSGSGFGSGDPSSGMIDMEGVSRPRGPSPPPNTKDKFGNDPSSENFPLNDQNSDNRTQSSNSTDENGEIPTVESIGTIGIMDITNTDGDQTTETSMSTQTTSTETMSTDVAETSSSTPDSTGAPTTKDLVTDSQTTSDALTEEGGTSGAVKLGEFVTFSMLLSLTVYTVL